MYIYDIHIHLHVFVTVYFSKSISRCYILRITASDFIFCTAHLSHKLRCSKFIFLVLLTFIILNLKSAFTADFQGFRCLFVASSLIIISLCCFFVNTFLNFCYKFFSRPELSIYVVLPFATAWLVYHHAASMAKCITSIFTRLVDLLRISSFICIYSSPKVLYTQVSFQFF